MSDTALEGTVKLLRRGFVMALEKRAEEQVCGGVLNILTGIIAGNVACRPCRPEAPNGRHTMSLATCR